MGNDFFLPKGQLVDLTHNYSEDTLYWPTEEGFKLEKEFDGMTEKGYYYSAKKFSAPEHGGTHMDAPIHFAQDGKSIDQIPLEQLMGNGIVVDVSNECKKNQNYQVTIDDFTNWESKYGKIPSPSIVFLHTGYGNLWPNRLNYLGTNIMGIEALSELRFPGLDPEAAKWLIENRQIYAIGIDTQSIDFGKSQFFKTHRILCSNDIPFFENIANLDKLPANKFLVIALPMKIKEGSGAPLRIVAIIPNLNQDHS